MGSLSDIMLSGGLPSYVGVQGEPIVVLTGPDAGKTFRAVLLNLSDQDLATELGSDPRGKRTLDFQQGDPVPAIDSQDEVQTSDGRIWKVTQGRYSGYLETKFEVTEVVAGKDS